MTIKATLLKAVETDASNRPLNLSSALCDIAFDLLHPSFCDIIGILCNMCQLGLVKSRWTVLEISQ